jgi:hypothetical protein
MTDMPERVWVGLARELDSNSRQVREIRYWGRSKFSNDCVQYTRTPDPLLEKMVEALRGMHEGEIHNTRNGARGPRRPCGVG